jgi:signal transduction histidine kinase
MMYMEQSVLTPGGAPPDAPGADASDAALATLLGQVAEATIDAILVVGAAGRILYHNRRYVEMWDVPDEVIGSRSDGAALAAVVDRVHDPEEFLARVRYLYDNPLERSRDEIRMVDGRVIDRYSAPILDGDGQPVARVWYFRDVSKVRMAQEEAELLARSGELFGASLDVEQTLGQIAQLIVPAMADWAAVDVLDEGGLYKRVGVAHADPGAKEVLDELHRHYPLRPGEGSLRGKVVVTGRPVALFEVNDQDLARVARDQRHRRLLARLGVRSALWVPLVARDRVLGVISVGYRDDRRRYGPAELELVSELARRAALAVDNALLYRAIERFARRQAAIAALGQRALAGGPLKELLRAAVDVVVETLDLSHAKLLELLPSGDRLRLVAGVGWRRGLVGRAVVGAGPDSQAGFTLDNEGPVVVEHLPTDPRFNGPRLLVEHGIISGLSVIIEGRDRPYGVLSVHSTEQRHFVEDDVNFLQAVANVLAAAIERDRTETRLTQLATAERARAAELKAVIQSIGEAVVVCDAAGQVVLSNPAAEDLLGGFLARGLRGILGAFHWTDAERRPSAGQRLESVELRLGRGLRESADGERWLELSTYPVVVGEDVGEGEIGTVLVMRDVTAARNARAMREAFLGMLSHELRTPVTTIYGGSEVLARDGRGVDDEARRGIYEDIRAEANRLHRLVENLLVLSRVERQGLQVDIEPVLVQRLLPKIVADEQAHWPGARFEVRMPAGLPPVAAEQTYLEQVLRNLLSNAAKYGGSDVVVVEAVVRDNALRVTVTDRGPGFNKGQERRLFEIFYRTPDATRRASGAGIGLFVTQQLIEAMGGRIWAANRAAGGAEFGFEVPLFGE